MAIVQLPSGMRLLVRDLHMMRDALLYGHSAGGRRLPRLSPVLVLDSVLPFVALPRLSNPAIAAGISHTCALQADGRLLCFGNNRDGQCDVPAGIGPVVAVAAGFHHTCALQADGRLLCFGDNDLGQCNVPADIGPIGPVTAQH